MNTFRTLAVSLAIALPLAAQGCPYERARTVGPSWKLGPAVDCDQGLTVGINGLQATTQPGPSCPLFVIITPTHEVPEPTDRPNRVRRVGLDAEKTAFFQCNKHYFLFFSTGSTCDFDRVIVTGNVQRLATEACDTKDREI